MLCICAVDSFAGLLKHGISATEPLIHSLNCSFLANDSWSQMVTMAANNARLCGDWGWREKSCGSTGRKNGILASVFSD